METGPRVEYTVVWNRPFAIKKKSLSIVQKHKLASSLEPMRKLRYGCSSEPYPESPMRDRRQTEPYPRTQWEESVKLSLIPNQQGEKNADLSLMVVLPTSTASSLLGWLGTPCWVFTCGNDEKFIKKFKFYIIGYLVRIQIHKYSVANLNPTSFANIYCI